MGTDIHTFIVRKAGDGTKGKVIVKDLYPGRNSEWFRNLQGMGCRYDSAYSSFNPSEGFPFDEIEGMESLSELKEKKYYGFNYITVKDFLDWVHKANPELGAGWVTTYEKWLYEKRGIIPVNPRDTLFKDDCVSRDDLHFISWVDKDEPSLIITKKMQYMMAGIDTQIFLDDYFVFYFDC